VFVSFLKVTTAVESSCMEDFKCLKAVLCYSVKMTSETARTHFRTYDAELDLSTNSPRLLREIRKDYGSFECTDSIEADGHIRILETDPNRSFPISVPEYAIREELLPSNAAIFRTEGVRYFTEGAKRIFRVDLEKNDVLGYLSSSSRFTEFLRFLLKWMLIKALEKKGTAFLHGSGVERDGTSIFFVGPSGYGKTHMLVTLLAEGYRFITDDTILLSGRRVRPFHIRSKVARDMLEKFPNLRKGLNRKSTRIPKVGWLLDLEDIFPSVNEEVKPSKLFYVYVWNSEKTKVEPVSKKEMLARLLHAYNVEARSSPWFNYEQDEAMKNIFPNYNSFVEEVNCYKVFAGSRPSITVREVEEA
jgi:hypothetical protein